MSEESKNPADSTGNPAGDQGNNRDIDERIKALASKNDEILGEKKKLQDEHVKALERLKEFEQKELERSGKHDEVIASLREEISRLKGENQTKDTTYGFNAVLKELKSAAKEAGCKDPDKLVKLIGRDDLKSIQVGADYDVNNQDISRVIEKMKKEADFFFDKKGVRVHDTTPSNGNPGTQKDVSQMTLDEKVKALADINRKTMGRAH